MRSLISCYSVTSKRVLPVSVTLLRLYQVLYCYQVTSFLISFILLIVGAGVGGKRGALGKYERGQTFALWSIFTRIVHVVSVREHLIDNTFFFFFYGVLPS